MARNHPSLNNLSLSVAIVTLLVLLALESPLGMDTPKKVAAAILVTAAALWVTESVPLFVTSFTVLLLSLVWLQPVLERSGQAVESGEFLAPFFSVIILLFMGGFVLLPGVYKFKLDIASRG